MAFVRDHGTCCLFIPLKLGVGFICMLTLAHSLICILALLTGDIRFQANGYNLHTYRLPSVVGSFGLIFGFAGLLGVYDDKLGWIRAFNRFLLVKMAAMLLAMVADYWELRKCDSWLTSPEHLATAKYGHLGIGWDARNVALDRLAEEHVCPWARWAYLIGFAVDFGVYTYLAYNCLLYELDLHQNMPYKIDFGDERHDAEARWRFFQVQDPRADARHKKKLPTIEEEPGKPRAGYGSLDTVRRGSQEEAVFGPDGMRVPRTDLEGVYGPTFTPAGGEGRPFRSGMQRAAAQGHEGLDAEAPAQYPTLRGGSPTGAAATSSGRRA